ncbi:uncharacterized protein BYT42DRAFT_550258 [Radiomyces spectabilis]|uniref:uncharacterized protein n=1 Tax=Radiomyces spectabilis TaxID=64574 RepID=UPI00221E62FB|nr:uncharacterized protein BYT42DRAFT_550258 [Radiomyces spectabilis]KAI8364627.1 hypothetical protein BYT42DRAFT_550258 [Radiomyces spectabilis]
MSTNKLTVGQEAHELSAQTTGFTTDQDIAMDPIEDSVDTEVDHDKLQDELQESLLKHKKNAAHRVFQLLADSNHSEQELISAQYDMDKANTAWEAFLRAKQATWYTLDVIPATQVKRNISALVPKDLPSFQVKGGPIRDSNKKVHDSVKAFISAFEIQLRAYNLIPLDEHWERLFGLTCDDSQRQWFSRTLADKGYTWEQAMARLEREFGNPFYIWRKKDEHRHMAQKPNESIRLFLTRYQEVSLEANLQQNSELVYNFVCSLQPHIKQKAWSTLTNHYGLTLTADLHQAAQLIMAACREGNTDSYHIGEPWNNGKRRYTNEDAVEYKRQKRSYDRHGNCPMHPKGSHAKEECHLWKKIIQEAAALSRSSQVVQPTSGNLCRYCKKAEYTRDHRCQEYRDAKSKKFVANRAAKALSLVDPDTEMLPVNLEKLDLQTQVSPGGHWSE